MRIIEWSTLAHRENGGCWHKGNLNEWISEEGCKVKHTDIRGVYAAWHEETLSQMPTRKPSAVFWWFQVRKGNIWWPIMNDSSAKSHAADLLSRRTKIASGLCKILVILGPCTFVRAYRVDVLKWNNEPSLHVTYQPLATSLHYYYRGNADIEKSADFFW